MAKSCRTSPSVHHCTVAPPTPSAGGGRGVVHGKVKGAVNSLKSAASGLIPAKREANSSLIEATTLTQVSGSTSSSTQANCDISSMRRRTVRDERLTLSNTERCSGQNRTEQNRTEQNRTEQNRTEQNRTEQNRTEQNRTEHKLYSTKHELHRFQLPHIVRQRKYIQKHKL